MSLELFEAVSIMIWKRLHMDYTVLFQGLKILDYLLSINLNLVSSKKWLGYTDTFAEIKYFIIRKRFKRMVLERWNFASHKQI